MDNNTAQWIWYPSDFEMWLNVKVHSERYERGMNIPPIWRLDTFAPSVIFATRFTVKEESEFTLYTDGIAGLAIDGKYIYDITSPIPLSVGEHDVCITVVNATSVPSIFIDSKYLQTNTNWDVSLSDHKWLKADSLSFNSKDTPPSSFKPLTKEMTPVSTEYINGGVLVDFGKEMMSRPMLEGIQGTEKLTIYYGESRTEALDWEYCELIDNIDCNNNFYADFTRAFRYIFIKLPTGVTIDKIYALYEYFPLQNKGSFNCSDTMLNEIYNTSLYTLELNARHFFLDGIKRDRWVWSGDATQSYLLNYYSFFDKDICKRTMRVLIGKPPLPHHLNTIQDYTLYWFISLYDYYFYTGDKEFVVSMYERAKMVMSYCINLTDENGFIKAQSTDWVFIDWADLTTDGTVSFIQMLYARALESMSLIAKLANDDEGAKVYSEKYKVTFENLFKTFWNNEKNVFNHSINSLRDDEKYKISRYANMFAMFFKYISPAQNNHIAQTVLKNDAINPITTPYMKFYELMALCECDLQDEVLNYMRNYWGGMLKLGATSFWEEYIPHLSGDEHYAMYGRKYGKSLCHAWGAGPICLLLKYFIGIAPTKAGYEEFVVSPHLCNLEFIEGSVPTPTGDIKVYLDKHKLIVENNSDGVGKIIYCSAEKAVGSNSKIEITL